MGGALGVGLFVCLFVCLFYISLPAFPTFDISPVESQLHIRTGLWCAVVIVGCNEDYHVCQFRVWTHLVCRTYWVQCTLECLSKLKPCPVSVCCGWLLGEVKVGNVNYKSDCPWNNIFKPYLFFLSLLMLVTCNGCNNNIPSSCLWTNMNVVQHLMSTQKTKTSWKYSDIKGALHEFL